MASSRFIKRSVSLDRCGRPDGQQSLPIQEIERVSELRYCAANGPQRRPSNTSISQSVIHHAIEVVALQPGGRITPHLAIQLILLLEQLRTICRNSTQKSAGTSDHVRRQPSRPLLEPVTAHRQQIKSSNPFIKPWIGMVELGQSNKARPTRPS